MPQLITLSKLATLVSENSGIELTICEAFIRNMAQTTASGLIEGEHVRIKDFGLFEPRHSVDGTINVEFVPETPFAERVNAPFAHLRPSEVFKKSAAQQPAMPQSPAYTQQPETPAYAQQQPAMPQASSYPQQPETPAYAQQQPAMPQSPAYPQQPETPAYAQQQPAMPQTPSYPQQPETPAYAQQPAMPQSPAYPQQPETPAYAQQQPAMPQTPAYPQQPETPAYAQQQPAMPQSPAYPQQPETPAYAQQPAMPQSPAYPQQPETPAYAQQPTMPQTPAYPQQPETPAYAQQPAMPQTPSYPQQPETPAYAQQQPAMPQSPAYTQQPETPDLPSYLNLPGLEQAATESQHVQTTDTFSSDRSLGPNRQLPQLSANKKYVLIGVLGLLAGFVLGYLTGRYSSASPQEPASREETAEATDKVTTPTPEQEYDYNAALSIANIDSLEEDNETLDIPQAEPKPQIFTVKVQKGQRLSDIALKHYGKKDYWVYIYLENRESIQNPFAVREGAVLRIPPKDKYAPTTDEAANLSWAKSKAAEINNKYIK